MRYLCLCDLGLLLSELLFHPDYLFDLGKLGWIFDYCLLVCAVLACLVDDVVESLDFVLLLLDYFALFALEELLN